MPDRLVCPFCKRRGFVRAERIITADRALTHYFCGLCVRQWDDPDPPDEHMPPRRARIEKK